MKHFILPIFGIISLQSLSPAQSEPPLLRPEERQAVDAQTDEFNQSLMPALTESAKSTVRIWAGKRRLAYGTVIGDGQKILTKWSEVARAPGNLRVESSDGAVLTAKISGVYEDEDLAVLETTGSNLTPVQWSDEAPQLGAFLAASQPNGRPAGFGVVSVKDRNLRDTDQAFLGVVGTAKFVGPGVKIEDLAPDSGAAKAGLKPGNIILKIGERTISGVLELRNALVGMSPGTTITLLVRNEDEEKTFEVLLGSRPNLPKFPGDRLRLMERMGGQISRVRDSFGRVIQTDMRLQPDQVGGPVVDLKGRVIGISMARAGRTNSYVMPAAAVRSLLEKDPQDPALVQAHRADDMPAIKLTPQGQPNRGGEQRMRSHLSEMQRLMDHLLEEMEGIEPQQ